MGQAHTRPGFSGSILLDDLMQHKENAFTSKERRAHGLDGRLSHAVEMPGDVTAALNQLFADAFALHHRTRSLPWQGSNHLHDYRLLFEECSKQVLDMTASIPGHARKLRVQMLRSIGEIACAHHSKDKAAIFVEPPGLLAQLHEGRGVVLTPAGGVMAMQRHTGKGRLPGRTFERQAER